MAARYCYRCPSYACSGTSTTSLDAPTCDHGTMKRDYRAEGVGIAVEGLKADREGRGMDERARLMLPSNSDFAGPGDPDGTKGMRQWREERIPRPGNSKPLWPGDVEKKVY